MQFKEISGSIVAPQGFLASGVFCDIKRLGTGKGSNKGQKRDLALIVSEVPADGRRHVHHQSGLRRAGESLRRAREKRHRAGHRGEFRQRQCLHRQTRFAGRPRNDGACCAKHLHMPVEHVLVGSTGRIGVTLPMANVRAGINEAVTLLDNSPDSAAHAAEAIMTSDTRPKQIAVEFKLGGKTVRIGGICKGAGMIQPGMSAHRQTAAALTRACTRRCFASSRPTRRLRRKPCRPHCRKPSRKVSIASPWTAT